MHYALGKPGPSLLLSQGSKFDVFPSADGRQIDVTISAFVIQETFHLATNLEWLLVVWRALVLVHCTYVSPKYAHPTSICSRASTSISSTFIERKLA